MVAFSNGADIIVADNHSTDHSVQWLEENFPEIHIIQLDKNYGFAGGYNKAIETVNHDNIVLLNSDVEVTEGWLNQPLNLLQSMPELAALQPKILAHRDKEKFEYAGAAGGYMDKHYYAFCRGRLFDDLETDNGQYNDGFKEVFWATGACLFVKRKAYTEVGGLDADFFAHMEEIDLCYRLKNSGYKVGYTGLSTVYHLGGGTLKKINPFKTYLNYRNNLFLIFKNHFHTPLIPLLFVRLYLDGLSGIVKLLNGEFNNLVAILKSHVHFYTNLSCLIRKRRANKQLLNNPNLKGLYKASLVKQYFINKKKSYQQLENISQLD